MKKKALSLFLSVLLILGAVVPFTLANGVDGDHSSSSFELAGGETCLVCGETGSHSASCSTRCSCGENKPASNHLFGCELFTCGLCGAYLTQTGGVHNANCRASVESRAIAPEACGECGMTGGTHGEGCSAAQVAPVASVPCAVCGMTDGHTLTCSTLCSCGENKPEVGHVATCDLYTCDLCGVYLNRTGFVHSATCGTNCSCGDQKPADGTHQNLCKLYVCPECGEYVNQLNTHGSDCSALTCPECGVYENQGEPHRDYCSKFLCPGCGQLVNQEGVERSNTCVCYFAELFNSVDENLTTENTYIAFVDKSQANVILFADGVQDYGLQSYVTVPTSACPVSLYCQTAGKTAT